MSTDPDLDEHFTLVKSASELDRRLLTVKSWRVTVSSATLGFGFQYTVAMPR